MKKSILGYVFINSLLVLLLTACTPFSTAKPAIHVNDSGQVVFSDINTHKVAKGIQIRGNVLKKTSSGKRITIPGHIHIVLIGKNGKELEIIKARTHRKYGNSRLWHFDGVLKTLAPVGSRIIVKYHNKHAG
jgi:hypothetical protein